jgi:hypothetical protein
LSFPDNYGKQPICTGPTAYIAIKHISDTLKWKEGKKEFEFNTISPECVTLREFDIEVKRLIKELETLKRQGKKFFEEERSKRIEYSEKAKLD